MPIEEITLSPAVVPSRFPGVRAILSGRKAGAFPINENADFQVVGAHAASLGGVSVNLRGTLIVRPNGTFDFDGDCGIENDKYDFDSKPWGQRSGPAEALVRVIGQAPGKPYVTRIVGSRPVHERGGA